MTEATQFANIQIGADYFRRCSINEYSNPLPYIYAREAIQNSIDANASLIRITLSNDGWIMFEDDGRGMSKETLVNKLLVLGGSEKPAGATGGFGKAKEVLFFCWDTWRIITANGKKKCQVSSDMIGKAPIIEMDSKEVGTSIMIKFPQVEGLDTKTWEQNIRFFVNSCSTNCKITLNDVELETMDRRGTRRELDWATIIVNKSIHSNKVFIRINGITMFYRYLHSELPALVMVDLKGNSIDILSSSRESMKSQYQRELDNLINDITSNPKSAIDNKPKKGFIKYDGCRIESVITKIQSIAPEAAAEFKEIIKQNTHSGITDYKAVERAVTTSLRTETAKQISEELGKQNISPLGYEFIVKGEIKRSGDLNMQIDVTSYKALKLMHYWKNIVLKVLQDNKIAGEFGVGFIFDDETNAECTTLNGKKYFLINPTIIKKTSDVMGIGMFMFPKACHEVAHLWESNHNETFTSAHGKLMEGMGTNFAEWKKLFYKTEEEVKARVKNN